jgi:hypothetical protein
MPPRRIALLVVTTAALAAPSVAHAGTAKVETYQTCVDVLQCKAMLYDTRQNVGYTGAAGEANDVTFSRSGNVVTVRDAGAPVTPETGCTSVSANEAACTVNNTFYSAGAALGDQADKFAVEGALGVPASATGAEGNDLLKGGDEANTFDGGPGLDVILSGAGDDKVSGGDDLDADTIDGGPGRDLLDYSARTAPVTVNLALATPAQGGPGEKDTVFDVEDVAGGKAADVLLGDGGANRISGGPGGDKLFGAAGADQLAGDTGADSFDGGAGNDSLATSDGGKGLERVRCGSGRDTVGQTDELGGDYSNERRWFGPELGDLLAADCERGFLPTEELDARLTFDPRLRKLSPVALAIANPCRGRSDCDGRVRVVLPGVKKAVGQARFGRRGRLVPIGISVVGERAVRRRKVLAVGLRVGDATSPNETFAVSYRTRAAR